MASSFTALYRYSPWDGRQKKRRSAEDIMAAIADDVLENGDIHSALQSLFRRGMPFMADNRLPGLHDLLGQLREKRREQLQRFNLDRLFDGIKEQLNEILAKEQEKIQQWLKGDIDRDANQNNHKNFSQDLFKNIAQRHREQLDQLPQDMAGKIKTLQDYDFLDAEAQKEFLKLLQQLRDAVTQTFFKDISNMVESMSEGDLSRMKDMVKALNDMLVKHIGGEDPNFEQFMQQYGDMFGDNPPNSLAELLAQMEAQMAATQSLLNSLSSNQQQQLEALLGEKFGDPELQRELIKLSKELSFLNPQGRNYNFSGEEEIDLQSAMRLMDQLQQLEDLEKQIQSLRDFSDLNKIDTDAIRELLGDDSANGVDELKNIIDNLEKAGFVRKEGQRWEMTPRGNKIIGQKALEEIYQKLKHQKLGNHKTAKEGFFGDQQEESKTYEMGDPFHLHIPRTLTNAINRQLPAQGKSSAQKPKIKLQQDDFEIHRHELNTKTSTVLLIDLSWSMALRDAFLPAKKVALALYNLISTAYPRDKLDIIGFSAYAREIKPNELTQMDIDQFTMGTNMHHALLLAEKKLSKEHAGSKQIIMISDGEPTAHLEDGYPYFEYPPNPMTIAKTLLAVKRCTQKKISINTFMLENSLYLRKFMNEVAQINGGRVFFTSPQRLGEYILHDYVENKRKKIGGTR